MSECLNVYILGAHIYTIKMDGYWNFVWCGTCHEEIFWFHEILGGLYAQQPTVLGPSYSSQVSLINQYFFLCIS